MRHCSIDYKLSIFLIVCVLQPYFIGGQVQVWNYTGDKEILNGLTGVITATADNGTLLTVRLNDDSVHDFPLRKLTAIVVLVSFLEYFHILQFRVISEPRFCRRIGMAVANFVQCKSLFLSVSNVI